MFSIVDIGEVLYGKADYKYFKQTNMCKQTCLLISPYTMGWIQSVMLRIDPMESMEH